MWNDFLRITLFLRAFWFVYVLTYVSCTMVWIDGAFLLWSLRMNITLLWFDGRAHTSKISNCKGVLPYSTKVKKKLKAEQTLLNNEWGSLLFHSTDEVVEDDWTMSYGLRIRLCCEIEILLSNLYKIPFHTQIIHSRADNCREMLRFKCYKCL